MFSLGFFSRFSWIFMDPLHGSLHIVPICICFPFNNVLIQPNFLSFRTLDVCENSLRDLKWEPVPETLEKLTLIRRHNLYRVVNGRISTFGELNHDFPWKNWWLIWWFICISVIKNCLKHNLNLSTVWGVRWGTWLGWLRFGMFHHPAWAVGIYRSGLPAGGTPQIKVNPTKSLTWRPRL